MMPPWSLTQGRPIQGNRALRLAGAMENGVHQDIFGHAFLVCVTGKPGEEMLAALRERETVRAELGAINRIRLGRLVGGLGEEAG